MPGIANLNVDEFQQRIDRFAAQYVNDWNRWLNAPTNLRPNELGSILRKWQACRPNRMRRTQNENAHNAPYLEDLIIQAAPHIRQLEVFEIREETSFSTANGTAFVGLWSIFENLSYHGRARNGLAGIVGISKAVLLLTDGRVGPAFDSEVRGHLRTGNRNSSDQWIEALRMANQDIQAFERKNNTTIRQATPQIYAHLNTGRIYDMALGPGA